MGDVDYRSDPSLVEYLQRLDERVAAVAVKLRPTYARCSAGAVTLTTAVETALTFTSWGHTYNMDVTGTKVTVTVEGVYLFTTNVAFASNATGYRRVRIRHNGLHIVAEDQGAAISGVPTRLSASGIFEMAAGDYVELLTLQTSGGNLDTIDDSVNEYGPVGGSSSNMRQLTATYLPPA